MKKKILALLCAVLMVVSLGTAAHGALYTAKQMRIADALHHVELFLGTNLGYRLEKELTRAEGITLLIRLLGEEEAAMQGNYTLPFTDVDDWAKPYVGYAFENGITKGVSDTRFGSQSTMTDNMFLTLVLRALGYNDSGDNPEFTWDSPYQMAKKAELIDDEKVYTSFLRGDAIEIFWNALARNGYELAYILADRGVFTRGELEESIEIYRYGEIQRDNDEDDEDDRDVSKEPVESGRETQSDSTGRVPETNAPETNPPEPNEPETDPETNEPESDPETNKPETDPETNEPETNAPDPDDSDGMTYEKYLAMSGEDQQAYFLSYANPADFFAWLNEAKADYEARNPSIEIGGDGSIDLGDLIG